jgi:adenosine deaminase
VDGAIEGQVGYGVHLWSRLAGALPLDVEQLRRCPKAELHLHLNGSLRPSTLEELARVEGLIPADAPLGSAMRQVRVTRRGGLTQVLASFSFLLPMLQSRANLRRVTHELVEDLAADGVVYAELRFCPRLNTQGGLTLDEVIEVVAEAAANAESAAGTCVRLIMCLMGGVDVEWNAAIVQAAIRNAARGVVGVDLAGPVAGRSSGWVRDHAQLFAAAHEAGLAVTIHAGEVEPPQAIRTAIHLYHADRIGHGTSLLKDPDLLAEVVDRKIVLETCPRSNFWTTTPEQMADLSDHPLGRLLRAGAKACVNTDDRSLFLNDMSSELSSISRAQGFTIEQTVSVIANGFLGGFAGNAPAHALAGKLKRVRSSLLENLLVGIVLGADRKDAEG